MYQLCNKVHLAILIRQVRKLPRNDWSKDCNFSLLPVAHELCSKAVVYNCTPSDLIFIAKNYLDLGARFPPYAQLPTLVWLFVLSCRSGRRERTRLDLCHMSCLKLMVACALLEMQAEVEDSFEIKPQLCFGSDCPFVLPCRCRRRWQTLSILFRERWSSHMIQKRTGHRFSLADLRF